MDLSPIYDLFHKNYRGRLTDLLSDSLFDLPPEQTAELPNILLMETAAHSLLGKHPLLNLVLSVLLQKFQAVCADADAPPGTLGLG